MPEFNEVTAVVKALDGDDALVEVTQTGCGRCNEPGGCGGRKLTTMLATGPALYRVNNRIGVQPGDCVRLGIPVQVLRRSATLAYVYPLCALVTGAVLGMEIGGDPGAIVGGLAGLVGIWYWMRHRLLSGAGNSAGGPHLISSD